MERLTISRIPASLFDYISPSFIKGIASVLDIGLTRKNRVKVIDIEIDAERILSDWIAVGKDIEVTLNLISQLEEKYGRKGGS